MVKKLIVLCLLSGCAQTPIVEIIPDTNQKEWNDKYNPTDWRKQFEKSFFHSRGSGTKIS